MTDDLTNLTLTEAEIDACRPRPGEGGRSLRGFCPFHGSDKQRSLRIDRETGRFQCFACGAWGYTQASREKWRDEQRRDGQYLPPKRPQRPQRASKDIRTPPPPPKGREDLVGPLRAYREALGESWGAEYLTRRRIALELAERVGVGYAASGQWMHAARDWRWGRVVFAHTRPDGALVNLYGRAVGSDEKVPKGKRHDHLPGDKAYFNAQVLVEGEGPVYVCEGAFDALALMSAGVDRAVAIYGVHGWRWDWFREVSELVFALDNDRAGQGWRALARAAKLRGKGVKVLPQEAYGGCSDVAEAWEKGVLRLG